MDEDKALDYLRFLPNENDDPLLGELKLTPLDPRELEIAARAAYDNTSSRYLLINPASIYF